MDKRFKNSLRGQIQYVQYIKKIVYAIVQLPSALNWIKDT